MNERIIVTEEITVPVIYAGGNHNSAYDDAVKGGYTGTETEFNGALAKMPDAVEDIKAVQRDITAIIGATGAGADIFAGAQPVPGYINADGNIIVK